MDTSIEKDARPVSPSGGAGRFRVLVLRSGALGDFILTLPVLEVLRRDLPRAEIVCGGRSDFAALAVSAGLVDTVVHEDRPEITSLFVDAPRGAARSPDALDGIGLAVSFLDSRLVAANLLRRGIPEVTSASPNPPPGSNRHAADHLLDAIRARCSAPARAVGRLAVSEEARARARTMLAAKGVVAGKYLAIHPGSGSKKKNWRASGFAEVARHLSQSAGLDVVVLSGPAEQADDSFHGELGECATTWLERPRLSLLSAVLGEAACFVGNDSGASHLAAACGAPTVAVFGPTDPQLWAPRGECVKVVRADSGRLEDVSASEVSEAAMELLGLSR